MCVFPLYFWLLKLSLKEWCIPGLGSHVFPQYFLSISSVFPQYFWRNNICLVWVLCVFLPNWESQVTNCAWGCCSMVAILGGMLGENREKLRWRGKLLGKQSKLATVGEKIMQRCNGGEIFGESNSSLYLFLLPGATIKPSPPNCIEALIINRTALKKATYYCPTFNFEFAFCLRFLHIIFCILHIAFYI